MNVGPLEIGIVLLIVLVIFGPKRLPQPGRSLGTGTREFKDAVTGRHKDDEPAELEAAVPAPAPGETVTRTKSDDARAANAADAS